MKINRNKGIKLLGNLMLCTGAFILCLPVIIMLLNSVELPGQILKYYYSGSPLMSFRVFPEILSLDQYYAAMIGNRNYVTALLNSLKYAVITTFIQMLCAILSAYGLTVCQGKWVKIIIIVLLFIMLIPYQAIEVPIYLLMRDMNLVGHQISVVLQNVFHPVPVVVMYFLIRGIEHEQLEAAQLDGAGIGYILLKVILPQSLTGISILFLLQYIDAWNMIEQPLVFLERTKDMPLSVLLPKMIADHSGCAFGFGVIFLMPVFLLYLSLQKEIEHVLTNQLYHEGS